MKNVNVINFLKELEQVNKENIISIKDMEQELKNIEEIVIIRTANLDLTKKLIEYIYNCKQKIRINLITYNRDFPIFQKLYTHVNLISYPGSEPYSALILRGILNGLNYNGIVFLYNNINGEGYVEIEKALIDESEVWVFNSNEKLNKIKNVRLKVLNQELLENIIKWYLTYNELKER